MRVIGLMCKAPRPGFAKTRLAAGLGLARAAQYAAAFLADSAALAAALGAATAFFAPDDGGAEVAALLPRGMALQPQAPGDLGQRLIAAFDVLFAQGAPALIMGTDSPDLPPALLEEALAAMAGNDAAFIPAHDGGYCAVALRAPAPALFQGIPWSSAETLRATLAAAEGLRVHLTSPWHDIDEIEDLQKLDLAAAPFTRRVVAPRG
jgi:hypothetical protein